MASKKGLITTDEYIISWSLRFFSFPFLLPLLFFINIPVLGDMFWVALLVSGSLNVVTTILYMKAIKYSDLSITVPMVAFTPLFLLMTSPFIVGEFPALPGLIGVFLIVIGSYVLNIKEKQNGYLFPYRALLNEKGPRFMLIVAFIWSITSNFDKIGIQNSSPIFWVIAINAFVATLLFPTMISRSRNKLDQISTEYKWLLCVGLFSALTLIFQMTALSLTLVVYVIAIKRTSTVMSVLWGSLMFKEKGIHERLLGAVIMILGILFMTL